MASALEDQVAKLLPGVPHVAEEQAVDGELVVLEEPEGEDPAKLADEANRSSRANPSEKRKPRRAQRGGR